MSNQTPEQLPKNSGLIIVNPADTDFIAGGESGIGYEILTELGDWSFHVPDVEDQYKVYEEGGKVIPLETNGCASFSANNVIETLLNFYIAKARLPAATLKFLHDYGYCSNGKVNLSDRYLATLSGTTKQGNTMTKVGDTIRHWGIVPESAWPWDIKKQFTFEGYYSAVPDSVKKIGLESLKYFEFMYEWVLEDFEVHLKQGPLQVAIPTSCPGYGTDTAETCPAGPNHAVMLYKVADKKQIMDQYAPFFKRLPLDYGMPYKMKYAIKILKKNESPEKEKLSLWDRIRDLFAIWFREILA